MLVFMDSATLTFTFTAHDCRTAREIVIRVDQPDDGRPYVELSDEAAERAIPLAAKRLGCTEDQVEITD
jgi:hypothetical protein